MCSCSGTWFISALSGIIGIRGFSNLGIWNALGEPPKAAVAAEPSAQAWCRQELVAMCCSCLHALSRGHGSRQSGSVCFADSAHRLLAKEKQSAFSYECLAVLWKSLRRERWSLLPLPVTSFLVSSLILLSGKTGTISLAPLPAKPPLLDLCMCGTMLSNLRNRPRNNWADCIFCCIVTGSNKKHLRYSWH